MIIHKYKNTNTKPGGRTRVTWGSKTAKFEISAALCTGRNLAKKRCTAFSINASEILGYFLAEENASLSLLLATNASLSPLLDGVEPFPAEPSQYKDKLRNFLHQICFHKSEFATKQGKLANILLNKKKTGKYWQ